MKLTLKHGLLGLAFAAFAGATLLPQVAEAARMGGGKSFGKQSSNVTQKQAPAAPAKQAAPATPATPAAAPAPARNKWLGPLAGIAAGLGIAALLSHLGMGGAMAEMLGSFLLIGALALGALFLWRMWKSKNAPAAAGSAGAMGAASSMGATGQPAFAGAAPGTGFNGGNAGFDRTAFTPAAPLAGGAAAATVAAGGGTWTMPVGFEVDDFLHIAKMYFVRLQAAWDTRNESDIRTFTTPEMYAEVKLDLVARGDAHNQTDVVSLNAEFLGVEEQGDKTLASVRLSGLIRETVGGPAEPFTEVWNLEKPSSAKASWVLAGIQQE